MRIKGLLLTVAGVAAGGVIALVAAGMLLASPSQRVVGDPPSYLRAQAVAIARANAQPISGWFAQGRPGWPGILLLHGVRADRRQMLGRARFLNRAGYSVLLIDMQAHGETPGEWITFGYRESEDARTAADYLRSRVSGQPVGLIGVSMGGAAALLGNRPVVADALVLEAVYSTIGRAVENRLSLRLGDTGKLVAPLFLMQIEPILGMRPGELSPVAAITRVTSPVLIVGGSADRRTQTDETNRLFSHASKPKSIWVLEGARHVDFHDFSPDAYEEKILEFFRSHLLANSKNAPP